jgi:hypothetical protein
MIENLGYLILFVGKLIGFCSSPEICVNRSPNTQKPGKVFSQVRHSQLPIILLIKFYETMFLCLNLFKIVISLKAV